MKPSILSSAYSCTGPASKKKKYVYLWEQHPFQKHLQSARWLLTQALALLKLGTLILPVCTKLDNATVAIAIRNKDGAVQSHCYLKAHIGGGTRDDWYTIKSANSGQLATQDVAGYTNCQTIMARCQGTRAAKGKHHILSYKRKRQTQSVAKI
eukprot:1160651-Pelagomonas_calceolata.AAC.2